MTSLPGPSLSPPRPSAAHASVRSAVLRRRAGGVGGVGGCGGGRGLGRVGRTVVGGNRPQTAFLQNPPSHVLHRSPPPPTTTTATTVPPVAQVDTRWLFFSMTCVCIGACVSMPKCVDGGRAGRTSNGSASLLSSTTVNYTHGWPIRRMRTQWRRVVAVVVIGGRHRPVSEVCEDRQLGLDLGTPVPTK